MPTYTATDPTTGQITYILETVDVLGSERTHQATDFDTANEHPWASYAITYDLGGFNSDSYIASIVSILDGGSSFTFENITTRAIGNLPIDIGDRTTSKDALGRVDYVYETFNGITPHTGPVPETSRAVDWDTATGHMDYAVTVFRDGHVTSIDYNSTNGNADYAVTTFANRQVVAEDYDAVSGKLDYRVTTNPDGSFTATDFDLTDQYSWTTYTLVHGTDGKVIDAIIA